MPQTDQPSALTATDRTHKRLFLPGLDGLRGLAVLLVMAYHFVGFIDPAKLGTTLLHSSMSAGWVGVEIFFVLSGFLITGILLDSKAEAHYFRNFYAKRVLRIFPLYYAVLCLLLVYSAYFYWASLSPPISLIDQLWLWLFASNIPLMTGSTLFTSGQFTFNHFWSLAIEEHFYLIWPIVVLRFSSRQLFRVTLTVFVAAVLLRTLLFPLIGGRGVYHFTLCRVDGLALGAFLSLLFRSKPSSTLLLNVARAVMAVSFAGLCAIALWRGGLRNTDRAVQMFGYSLIALAAAGLLTLVVWGDPVGLIQRAFSSRPLRFFGVYSYGIYVFHGVLRPCFASMIPHLENHVQSYALVAALYLLISMSSSVLLAVISYQFYELRFLRLKRRFE